MELFKLFWCYDAHFFWPNSGRNVFELERIIKFQIPDIETISAVKSDFLNRKVRGQRKVQQF